MAIELGYGPGSQPYTTVMPQDGNQYMYDAQGNRYQVPIGFKVPATSPKFPVRLSKLSQSNVLPSPNSEGSHASGSLNPFLGKIAERSQDPLRAKVPLALPNAL